MGDLENQLAQPSNNTAQNAAEKSSYDARVLELSDPVSLQILLVPVRLIFENNSRSPDAFEEETVKNLTKARCPITRENVIGYIYDNDKKAEVTAFLVENPAARSLQYTNGTFQRITTWSITTHLNDVIPNQGHLSFRLYLLRVAFSGVLTGAVCGGFLALFSVLGASMLQDSRQEMSRQAQTALVGGTATTITAEYLTMAYRLFYIKRDFNNYEVMSIITIFVLAALASIPLGARIVPFGEHNSIGSMIGKQLCGAVMLTVVTIIFLFGEKICTTNNLSESAARERQDGPLIPLLPDYVESTILTSTMTETPSSASSLQLTNLESDLYLNQQNVVPSFFKTTSYMNLLPGDAIASKSYC